MKVAFIKKISIMVLGFVSLLSIVLSICSYLFNPVNKWGDNLLLIIGIIIAIALLISCIFSFLFLIKHYNEYKDLFLLLISLVLLLGCSIFNVYSCFKGIYLDLMLGTLTMFLIQGYLYYKIELIVNKIN